MAEEKQKQEIQPCSLQVGKEAFEVACVVDQVNPLGLHSNACVSPFPAFPLDGSPSSPLLLFICFVHSPFTLQQQQKGSGTCLSGPAGDVDTERLFGVSCGALDSTCGSGIFLQTTTAPSLTEKAQHL